MKDCGELVFNSDFSELKAEFNQSSKSQKAEFTKLFCEILLDDEKDEKLSGLPEFESKHVKKEDNDDENCVPKSD